MSRMHGPVRTYRNGMMDTKPGDVVITDKRGTRVVKVDGPSSPTFENYEHKNTDGGVVGAPWNTRYVGGPVKADSGAALATPTEVSDDSAPAPASTTPEHDGFEDRGVAGRAAKALAMATGIATTVVESNGKWIVQTARSSRRV